MSQINNKLLNVGGQAVIEGVMMKSPHFIAVAVRKPNKKITVKIEKCSSITQRFGFLRLPFFRGIIMLFEMLSLGIKALHFSANEAADEKDEKLSNAAIIFTIMVSLAFALLLFVLTPYALTTLLNIHEETNAALFNLVDGIIKLTLFLIYIVLISKMEDIRRVFQYHGAEHKAVNCYEAKKKLTVKNAQSFTTLNARCGTSFILFVILIGVVVFSFIPIAVNSLFPSFAALGFIAKKSILFGVRLIFILPLAGISYEILKLSAYYQKNFLFRLISLPGLAVQKLTTREPNDEQVEVALAAMEAVLKKELSTYSKAY
ncbi:DUF1385 domain-containing protein [Candidatus Woesearchaeota archaeon]|nr:DUF1385 domain-containing protein [Candidatus Woesearchaeota archaeon]